MADSLPARGVGGGSGTKQAPVSFLHLGPTYLATSLIVNKHQNYLFINIKNRISPIKHKFNSTQKLWSRTTLTPNILYDIPLKMSQMKVECGPKTIPRWHALSHFEIK
jgi:hypothetical protein